jgi:hypothetical protein
MDRSMKVMFGMMTVAICLLAITMMNTQSQQAYAGEYVGGGDRGTVLTIVSFRVTQLNGRYNPSGTTEGESPATTKAFVMWRMWSDGAIEVNIVAGETIPQGFNNGNDFTTLFASDEQFFTGWRTVTDSVAGYACAGDTDGDREVDVHDLLAVVEQWGQCEEDPTTGLPDDGDLM